ncbi:outer membrane receptor for ferrienterochelin and colicins [Apibacter mensalis]|uniref:Outer membrane receptor for ferrienterochelin and colicins n=1 Tax=Apibacter mensalis TaxID=1586267 RepID=A0A0X3ANB7_9FLAO|nr:TonB-dependent receptor [Apibacter mensalis]CVK15555.1 outer membrane receptor for ferrienterochelin and colicins [Apibacter mensalis]
MKRDLTALFVLSLCSLYSQEVKDSFENNKEKHIDDIVITGTLKEVRKSDSTVPVEIITPKFFQKNPTPSLFDAVGMINGVKPQLNCSVCNTGDIHINGMEGPYTMILIDGMPIVSGLATVYGLSGIPNSLVERIEVVKGPASSLYGSEAMGGIINVITKNPQKAPKFAADIFSTSWGELSTDLSFKFNAGKKAAGLLGINHFYYDNPMDANHDGFTDLTLQNRISVFNKWSFKRKDNRIASLGLRWVNEDRWGGEMKWNKKYRGSDQIYGESIYTKRAEIIGLYQLPLSEKIFTQFSYNWHNQNSWYGETPFMATQQVAFIQSYWDRTIKNHNLLAGASFRYTYFDDNTPATSSADGLKNKPAETPLPGLFLQDEWTINDKNKLLIGYRYDNDKHHGNVHSPRIAYKFTLNHYNSFRASLGTGFRVVNIFTEDHSALTGARDVVILNSLKPERSYNGNLNYVKKIMSKNLNVNLDVTGFYSYFTNKIIGDFDSNPTKIIYDNLNGHAVSQGISLNTEWFFLVPFKIIAGITYMNVYTKEKNDFRNYFRIEQLYAPKWSGTFVMTYTFPQNFILDFSGQWNGKMRLPIEPNDFRNEYSPWYCIANIQLTKKFDNGMEIYGGIKNLFNFTPKNPIMRPFDPFNKDVDNPVTNSNGYTFDTSYNYASLQKLRGFIGIRYNFF